MKLAAARYCPLTRLVGNQILQTSHFMCIGATYRIMQKHRGRSAAML